MSRFMKDGILQIHWSQTVALTIALSPLALRVITSMQICSQNQIRSQPNLPEHRCSTLIECPKVLAHMRVSFIFFLVGKPREIHAMSTTLEVSLLEVHCCFKGLFVSLRIE